MNTSDYRTGGRFNDKLRNSVSIRIASVLILTLLLMIPMSWISNVIDERQYIRRDAIQEVSEKWGQSQTVSGPVLSIPYIVEYRDNDKNTVTETHYAHFLPDQLDFDTKLMPEVRYRGIYEVIVYETEIMARGNFSRPDFSDWKIPEEKIDWDAAFISLGVPDMRGITESITLKWNQDNHTFNPGGTAGDIISSGVSTRVNVEKDKATYNFDFKLNLRGSQSLLFTPLGRETTVKMESEWTTPSFTGSFLPKNREITEKGFTAEWKVLDLNRNYPQKWRDSQYAIYDTNFGLDLLLPVDEYTKTSRSAKYAIMFIALTFLIFFVVEVINKKHIHPIQYILVGLALLIFYTLLLSISEHLSFNLAYLIASVSVISLITVYVKGFFKDNKLTAIASSILVILYGFLFILLQLQDYALLMGSIGLFIILAIVMILSRKIDWYTITQTEPEFEIDSKNMNKE